MITNKSTNRNLEDKHGNKKFRAGQRADKQDC